MCVCVGSAEVQHAGLITAASLADLSTWPVQITVPGGVMEGAEGGIQRREDKSVCYRMFYLSFKTQPGKKSSGFGKHLWGNKSHVKRV